MSLQSIRQNEVRCMKADIDKLLSERQSWLDEIERLRLGLAAITDETVTDIYELRNIAREVLGWPARTPEQQQSADIHT